MAECTDSDEVHRSGDSLFASSESSDEPEHSAPSAHSAGGPEVSFRRDKSELSQLLASSEDPDISGSDDDDDSGRPARAAKQQAVNASGMEPANDPAGGQPGPQQPQDKMRVESFDNAFFIAPKRSTGSGCGNEGLPPAPPVYAAAAHVMAAKATPVAGAYGAQQRKQAFVLTPEPLQPSSRLFMRKSSNGGGVPATQVKPPAMVVRLMPGTPQQQHGLTGWGGLQVQLPGNAGAAAAGSVLPDIPRVSAFGAAPGGAAAGAPTPKAPFARSRTLDGGHGATPPATGGSQGDSPLLPKIRTRVTDSPAPQGLWAKASSAVRARAITLDGGAGEPVAAGERAAPPSSRFNGIVTPRGVDSSTTATAAAAITRGAPAFSPPAPRQLRMCQSLDGRRVIPEPSPAFRALTVPVDKEPSDDLSTTMLSSGSEADSPTAAAAEGAPASASDAAAAVPNSALDAPLGGDPKTNDCQMAAEDGIPAPASKAVAEECQSESSISLSSDSEDADGPATEGAPQPPNKAVEVAC